MREVAFGNGNFSFPALMPWPLSLVPFPLPTSYIWNTFANPDNLEGPAVSVRMRLIDTESLRLVEVQGDSQQDYAILSHTWGPSEVVFAKFTALTSPWSQPADESPEDAEHHILRSDGFLKIRNAELLAKRQGFSYLWVDTCCIDKTSSAELSESINSMYRWYRKAAICYAYLSDVNTDMTAAEGLFNNTQGSGFRKSRWFTRGWTLQELVAPRKVEFYASDWSSIGTKGHDDGAFCRLLADITGINQDILEDVAPLSEISVADKMSWASSRQTTREEGLAYCLLGLFNVNMPLLYGEGQKAFIRLQEEIIKETDDQSLFFWNLVPSTSTRLSSTNPDALFGLLAESPRYLTRPGISSIRRLPPLQSQETTPASVTNQGLRTNMRLYTMPPNDDEYYALLDRFSVSLYALRADKPQPGKVIAVLRFGCIIDQRWCPLVDLAVGFRRSNKHWEVCYQRVPFTGRRIDEVYRRLPEFPPPSFQEASHSNSSALGCLVVKSGEYLQRGRRIVQLAILGTPQLSYAIASSEPTDDPLQAPIPHFKGDMARIVEATRQCCCPETIDNIFLNTSSTNGLVRTKMFDAQQEFDKIRTSGIFSTDRHYGMLQAVVQMQKKDIKVLIYQDRSSLECQTKEFDDFRPIHWAATLHDNSEMAKLLISMKAEMHSQTRRGWMAVHLAILAQNHPCVSYLLPKGNSKDCQTITGETISHLIAAYAPVSWFHTGMLPRFPFETRKNNRGELPIHRAAATGNFEALRHEKLTPLSQVDAKDNEGRSPLFHAVCGGQSSAILRLISNKASLDLPDVHGRSPLHAAVLCNRPDAVELLLEKGADVEAHTTANGLTPLHLASLYGYFECMQKILKCMSHKWRDANCVKGLLEKGCNLDTRIDIYLRMKKPKRGAPAEAELIYLPTAMTPLELAIYLDNSDMASIIYSNLETRRNGTGN
ncbi:Vegetative incompatibility protein HET-E-1 [Colletotrichum spinosum]|uniref:Vegetative incompatibility protein HET-E-1 n=1 Tax=Colletotrichum spinosum TaxID=1347390 RepID=A0A4R8Q678_9PEZI|nr:Vegetative incompatibility protein HET-E-1 [Colletotrichum spinosum]